MRLSQQTRNAIRILIFCAEEPDVVHRISDIASGCKITEYNTFKLVPVLVQGQFLNSIRGRNGGVKLSISPDDIRIGAVIRTMEVIDAGQSPLTMKPCENYQERRDFFENMMTDAFDAFLLSLDENTIADFLHIETLDEPLPLKLVESNQTDKSAQGPCTPAQY